MNMFQVNNKEVRTTYLLKTVLFPHDEVLTGFEYNFIAPRGDFCSRYLNKILIKLEKSLEDSKRQPKLIIIEKVPG